MHAVQQREHPRREVGHDAVDAPEHGELVDRERHQLRRPAELLVDQGRGKGEPHGDAKKEAALKERREAKWDREFQEEKGLDPEDYAVE